MRQTCTVFMRWPGTCGGTCCSGGRFSVIQRFGWLIECEAGCTGCGGSSGGRSGGRGGGNSGGIGGGSSGGLFGTWSKPTVQTPWPRSVAPIVVTTAVRQRVAVTVDEPMSKTSSKRNVIHCSVVEL